MDINNEQNSIWKAAHCKGQVETKCGIFSKNENVVCITFTRLPTSRWVLLVSISNLSISGSILDNYCFRTSFGFPRTWLAGDLQESALWRSRKWRQGHLCLGENTQALEEEKKSNGGKFKTLIFQITSKLCLLWNKNAENEQTKKTKREKEISLVQPGTAAW